MPNPSFILQKAQYTSANGEQLAPAYLTPIGLFVDDGSSPAVRQVWGVFRTVADLEARRFMVGTHDYPFQGSIRDSQPQLYAGVTPAMEAAARAVHDVVVDPTDPTKNISWLDDATIYTPPA